MPRASFFAGLGLFVADRFFDATVCASLRDQTRSARTTPSTVVNKGTDTVDPTVRRVLDAWMPPETISFVTERLMAIKPALESHFDVPLQRCQQPQFLIYRPGDFFRFHSDVGGADEPESIRERQISIVVFLNDESEQPITGLYSGGLLTFFDLVDDPRFKDFGLPLSGEEGQLIAFRSQTVHSVTPVTHGERYTIVTWFC